MKQQSSRRVARIGMLAGLTIALHLAPALMPGLGLALSTFSTLPIYVLTRISPRDGLIGLAAASAVLVALMPGSALLLALMTGPVGLALGWAANAHWRSHWRILLAAGTQTAGITAIGAIVGVPVFGRFIRVDSQLVTLGLAAAFCLIYSLLWAALLDGFLMPLLRRTSFGPELR